MRLWLAVLLTFGLGAGQAAPASAQEEPSVEKRIALSFDDVPRERGAFFTPDERAEKLIEGLKEAGVEQAVFFVTPGNLATPDGQGGEARISAYVAAGHVIANHSYSHSHLSKTGSDAYLADIDRTEAWLEGRPGYRPWFRFPYLDEGAADKNRRDAVRAGLTERGLRNGYVTADGSDWNLEALTVEAKAQGRELEMDALRKLYLQSQLSGVAYHDALARRVFDRRPAHMLLLHETDLAALFIVDLVKELRREGWTIITADEAYAEPLLRDAAPEVPYSWGTLTGSMAWERDVQPPLTPIWMTPAMVGWLFERNVVKTPAVE